MTLPARRDANRWPGQGANMSLLTRLALTVAVALDGFAALRRRTPKPTGTPIITGSITTTRTSTP